MDELDYIDPGYIDSGYFASQTIPRTKDINDYLNLITSEHSDKPKFMAMIEAMVQPFVDIQNVLYTFSNAYDLDQAEGKQLDVIGEWVGISRDVKTPLEGVYFALDTVGVGLDEGVWLGPYDDPNGLTTIPDEFYKLMIFAKIANNHWTGSIPEAIRFMNLAFNPYGYYFCIDDSQNLEIGIGLVGGSGTPTPIIQQLLTTGKFDIRPAGVGLEYYFWQSQQGPIFALDVDNQFFSGLDSGSLAVIYNP